MNDRADRENVSDIGKAYNSAPGTCRDAIALGLATATAMRVVHCQADGKVSQ